MSDDIPLEEISGVGKVRADALRSAGYRTATDIATASVTDLHSISKIGHDTAKCILETAREACGHEDTFAAELAEDINANRKEISATYAELAPSGVTPEEAEPTLRRLFDRSSEQSVLRLTRYSLKYRHFLLQAGFEQLEDVAEASTEELTEVEYIGPDFAARLQEAAADALAKDSSTFIQETAPSSEESFHPWQYVCVSAPNYVEWSDSSHIIAHRWYDPEVWEQDPESHQIIRYAKQDDTRLKDNFTRELAAIYRHAIAGSDVDPEYIAVMPGHGGEPAEPLVELAQNIAGVFDIWYKELLTRSGAGKRQKCQSIRGRWQNQDETLEATRILDGKSVVVIDDISTSGASFTTATHRLHKKGADVVVCMALALTKGQRQAVTAVDSSQPTITEIADDL